MVTALSRFDTIRGDLYPLTDERPTGRLPADGDRFEAATGTSPPPPLESAPDVPVCQPTAVEPSELLTELGFDPTTRTIEQTLRSDAIAAARQCGEELDQHSRIYGDYLREKLLLSVRAYSADYVRGRDGDDSPLAARLDKARSLAAVAEALRDTGYLEAAVAFAARQVAEPLERPLARVGRGEASLADLDGLEVAIIDLNTTGTIDERDIVAVEIGGVGCLAPLGSELADRLRMSACIVRGMDDMVDSFTGNPRLEFTPGRFDGPENHFRVAPDCFKLRQERVPDKPWLTRATSASAALRHVRDHADDYTMDCAAAISVAWFLGKYHEIGELAGAERQDAVFDELTPHLTIGKWHVHWSNVLMHRGLDIDPRTDVPLPGESRYFEATDISPRGKLAGWMGENVLFYGIADCDGPGYRKGERLWWGHPFGLTGERSIVETLNDHSFDLDPSGLPALRTALAAMSASGSLGHELTTLENAVSTYAAARDHYENYMKTNRRPYVVARDRWELLTSMSADERTELLEREGYEDVDLEYQRVLDHHDFLRRQMVAVDIKVSRSGEEAAGHARRVRSKLVALLDEPLAETARAPLDAALNAVDVLLPAPSALHDKGRLLLPYRAFQAKYGNAIELV